MSLPRRSLVALLALASVCGVARAQQPHASLVLFPEIAAWDDPVEARIEGFGCGGKVEAVYVEFTPGFGWTIDIDLAVSFCTDDPTMAPFTTVATLGPLAPAEYTVRLLDTARHIVSPPPPPLDTAPLSVRRRAASLSLGLPGAATDAAPFTLVFRGHAPSACFSLDPPIVRGNVIEAFYSSDCPILPADGPHLFAEGFQLGPLPAGEYDVRFFDVSDPAAPAIQRQRLVVHDADRCVPSDTALCLQNGRFRVQVTWADFASRSGVGHALPLAGREDSGLFWFFSPGNVELTVKVLNGCGIGGTNHWWVFLSSGSTVDYTVTVTDTSTGRVRTYSNPPGHAAPLIADTSAFTCGT